VSIEWFRDLVVCIFGLGATVAVIILVVLAFILFIRVQPIISSLKATTKTVANISSCVEEEVAKPLAQVAAFVQGIRQAIGLVNRFKRKKEED
jgi:RsiW-degrading membrane proteinase PrsW (M82 family)